MPPNEPNSPAAGAADIPVAELIDKNEAGYELVEPVGAAIPIAHPYRRRDREATVIAWWVRGALVLMALGFVAIFAVGAWLNPYDEDGLPRSMATHTQLGLPPCNMIQLIGKPCPACGMTTSFSLLMHGDLANSLRANWAGTLLALGWMALIPWGIASAVRGKFLFVRDAELWISLIVILLLVAMIGRWVIVLLTWDQSVIEWTNYSWGAKDGPVYCSSSPGHSVQPAVREWHPGQPGLQPGDHDVVPEWRGRS